MKTILLASINFYQNFLSIILKNILGVSSFCRNYPTCSEYAKESISQYGAVKGGLMAIERVLKCQPFVRPQYDRS